MADESAEDGRGGSDMLEVPFVFVKHGDPLPTEWMARHPGWVKFPATMVPRDPAPADTITPGQAYSSTSEGGPAFVSSGMERPVAAGAPISVGRFGGRTGGRPPRYPGGFGAGPGGGAGPNEDPVAVYLQMSEALWPKRTMRLSDSSAPNVRSAPADVPHKPSVRARQPESANAGLRASDFARVFIFDGEARGQLDVTKHTHWPKQASGVTLGPGYDMRFRSPEQIQADLEGIGIDPEKAKVLSAAGKIGADGLFGQAAAKFAKKHEQDVTLTIAQQRALLRLVLAQYEAELKRLVRVPLNQNEFDALLSFTYSRGSGHLQDIVVTLNRGDREATASVLQHYDDKLDPGHRHRREAESALMRRPVEIPNRAMPEGQ